jgi:hypothetical protein
MTLPRLAVALVALLPLGCAFFGDSGHGLTTHTSPLPAPAGSIAGHDQDESYREDVSEYTYDYVDADGELPDFEGGLGEIAERHGVSDWDASDATYLAIGVGLAQAQVSSSDLDDFKRVLGRSDPLKMTEIQRGFDHRR